MGDRELDSFRRMFGDDGRAAATPLANHLQAIARIVVRSALRTYPKELDLSFVHAAVIGGVGTFGPVAARDLATLLTMHEGQLSRAIKQLEDKGWVARIPDPADSRRKMVMLTREGKRLYAKVMDIQKAREDSFLDGVDEGDRQAFFKTLRHIRANAETLLAREA